MIYRDWLEESELVIKKEKGQAQVLKAVFLKIFFKDMILCKQNPFLKCLVSD